VGQSQHNTVALARNEDIPIINITTREWVLIYRVTYKEQSGSAVWIETSDYTQVRLGPGSSYTPASHQNLTNRDAVSSHPATAIAFSPNGDIAATDVQAAIEELDSEKAAKFGPVTFDLDAGDFIVEGGDANFNDGTLVVNTNSQVGVNTAAPAATLDVNGEIAQNGTVFTKSGKGTLDDEASIDILYEAGFDGDFMGNGWVLFTHSNGYKVYGTIIFCYTDALYISVASPVWSTLRTDGTDSADSVVATQKSGGDSSKITLKNRYGYTATYMYQLTYAKV
jgi:hypothetical protein